MTNQEKYEGKTVQIYAPFNGNRLNQIKVSKVIEENVLYGTIVGTDIETAYYLNDGIKAEIIV